MTPVLVGPAPSFAHRAQKNGPWNRLHGPWSTEHNHRGACEHTHGLVLSGASGRPAGYQRRQPQMSCTCRWVFTMNIIIMDLAPAVKAARASSAHVGCDPAHRSHAPGIRGRAPCPAEPWNGERFTLAGADSIAVTLSGGYTPEPESPALTGEDAGCRHAFRSCWERIRHVSEGTLVTHTRRGVHPGLRRLLAYRRLFPEQGRGN